MAGDWIKVRHDLATSPKVVRISSALKADRLRTVGGLVSAWCLFDVHSVDGTMEGYTPDTLDELIGWPGFSRAMIAVGWLLESSEGLELPRFTTHNGQSAKRRALDAERKRLGRLSAFEADRMRTREEKSREEEIQNPGGGDAGSSDRLTVLPNSQAPRWSRAEGLFLPASAIAGLRKAFPDADLEAMLAGWDAWRQGEDGMRARNPMGSIESWIRNRSGAVAAGEAVPVLSDEEELAIIRAADA